MSKCIFKLIATSFLLICFGQSAHAQISDGLNILKNKLEKAVKEAVPSKKDKVNKDDPSLNQNEDMNTNASQSSSRTEIEKTNQKSAISEDAAAMTLPEPSSEGWKKESEQTKTVFREIGNSAYTVYAAGIKKHFSAGFKICEEGVNESIDEEIKKLKANAKNLDSKKEIAAMEAEADGLDRIRGFVARLHCLNRTMIALAQLKSGLVSPVIDDWIAGTKNIDYEDLTPTAIKKINEQIGRKHEEFIQGDILMRRLTDAERRNLKKGLNLRNDDISAAGVVRFSRYQASYEAMFKVLDVYLLTSADKFNCKFDRAGKALVVCN